MLGLLCVITFIDKWINLHYHQVTDFLADQRCGVTTFAVSVGVDPARRWLRIGARLSTLADLMFMAAMLPGLPRGMLLTALGCVAAVILTVYVGSVKRRSPPSPMTDELPWYYLALTLTTFRVLPIILLGGLALMTLMSWWVLALCCGVVLLEFITQIRSR